MELRIRFVNFFRILFNLLLLIIKKSFVTDSSLILNISVYDKSKVSHDSFLGKVEIAIRDLPDGVPSDNWYTLQPKQPGKKSYGEIKLGILYRKEN